MLDLVVSCSEGLEDLLEEELRELGYHPRSLKPAKVRLQVPSAEHIVRLNAELRQAHGVFILLMEARTPDLAAVREAASAVPFSEVMDPDQTFAVRGSRIGEHAFTSVDLAREVGSAVVDHFLAKRGRRVRAHLKDPDVEFVAELSGDHFLLLLNTSGESLHKRYPLPFHHFAPLKSSIAASMIRLSSFSKTRNLLDPMAGGGTIVIEACMSALGIPPARFRRAFAFEKLRFVPSIRISSPDVDSGIPATLGAADRYLRNIRGLTANLKALGMDSRIRIWKGDAETLSYLKRGEFSLVVTNPPYGLRLANPDIVDKLYLRFAQAAADQGIEEIVVLTPRKAAMQYALGRAGYKPVHTRRVLYGRLSTALIRAVVRDR